MGNSIEKHFDICIIGGGAAGLVASIVAARRNPSFSVAIIEKMDEPGKKVAAAGNGRCNLSNLEAEGWEEVSAFFSSIGLITRADNEGRVYPHSEDGRDVVRCLVNEATRLGVEILTRRYVEEITKEADDFVLTALFNRPKAYHSKEEDGPLTIHAKQVLIATGGKSKPKLGTTGDGFTLAKKLGHSVNTLIPVLTGVETSEDIKGLGLSGIREKCNVSLFKDDALIYSESGEMQFTDYGVSGIVIFDMTRFMDLENGDKSDFKNYRIEIDFLPELTEDVLVMMIRERMDAEAGGEITPNLICSWVKKAIAEEVVKRNLSSKKADEDIAKTLKHFTLYPTNLKGWDMAQVTRGGVPVSEIDDETGESNVVKGLFFAGEILDRDYRCGGFNLQHAWITGIKAGNGMGGRLE